MSQMPVRVFAVSITRVDNGEVREFNLQAMFERLVDIDMQSERKQDDARGNDDIALEFSRVVEGIRHILQQAENPFEYARMSFERGEPFDTRKHAAITSTYSATA